MRQYGIVNKSTEVPEAFAVRAPVERSAPELPRVTLTELREMTTLPVWSTTKPSAASVCGVGRSTIYAMAEAGELPGLMRLRGRLVVSVPRLLEMLGDRP
jgi:hypothetical protein